MAMMSGRSLVSSPSKSASRFCGANALVSPVPPARSFASLCQPRRTHPNAMWHPLWHVSGWMRLSTPSWEEVPNDETRWLTSMSQSTRPNASENVHRNWLIPAHFQSVRSFWTSGEGGGGGGRDSTGAMATVGRTRLGIPRESKGTGSPEGARWRRVDACPSGETEVVAPRCSPVTHGGVRW